jgi:two-component system, sensor histidine kinase and response regulator
MEGDRQRCLAAGMDGYITKPVKVEELVEIIENLGRFPVVADTVVASKSPEQHSIDHASALAHVGGDFELLKEITGLFLKEIPQLMATLQGAIQSGDAVSLQRAAHKLKGSVGNFAAQPAFDAASTLEVLGMEGRLAEAAPAYENLVKEIAGLKMAMLELIGPEARP